MRSVRGLLVGYVLILLVAGAPIISLAVAGTIANMNGCTLHEGFTNPCIVNGVDMGQTLYTMSMLGFIAIATIPIGVIALVLWTVAWLLLFLRARRKPRLTP